MNNTFKTYKTKEYKCDLLPVGFMNYEMISKTFHVYEYEDPSEDYMKNNPLYYGYISIEIFDNDINNNNNDGYFDNFNLFVNNESCYEISSKNKKIKHLNETYLNTIEDTKNQLQTRIINIKNKVIIKKELLKICKYDAVYEILKFI